VHVYRLALRTPVGGAKAVLTYAASSWLIQRQVEAILRRHRTEVVHVQCVSSNGLYARHAARALGLPLIVSAQGERTMDAGRIYQRSEFMVQMLKQLLREATFVTACSGDTLRDLETFRGEDFGARGSVIYNGIHPEDFANATPHKHPKPYIIALGRLVPQKGFDVLWKPSAKWPTRSRTISCSREKDQTARYWRSSRCPVAFI
jgi:glycosyltransferase involved in cell wall biosynthesis